MIKINYGFSLIELMVSLSIMAIIMSISSPLYVSWISKIKIQSSVDSISTGITQARTEAIRRNSIVVFNFNKDNSWKIINSTNGNIITQKKSEELLNSNNLIIKTIPENSYQLTFNGMGFLTKNSNGTEPISKIEVHSNINDKEANPIYINISGSGISTVCDPQISNNLDYRYCK